MGRVLRSLIPGNDRELARTDYSGRESATERARRKEAEARARRAQRHQRSAADPADPFNRDGFTKRRGLFG
ncbi:hypothetical protein SAMN05428942_7302 [Streptomyces sp. 2112.2]|uniref:hypothetical protein n=1 Tax=Streptomyces sp. 2112.2 TaxID=1881024 RepID=UPI00089C295D|nr:hypothetical protein [Streptomyces sp. 2112.2]SEF16577.1 hypothetical protein SAMN05428942_7302 [Streptomyces sp. 2112.2]